MSGTPPDHPRESEAIEYALGTLAGNERATLERDLAGDPALAALVREWEDRLASLAGRVPSVEPSPAVWEAIRAAVEETPGRGAVSAFPGPAELLRLRRSRALWRGAAAAATALAALLALWIVVEPFGPAASGSGLVAVVNRSGELPALIIRVDPKAGIVQVRTLAAETPPGRSLELWSIVDGGAPRSLGLVAPGPLRAAIPASERGRLAGATLAVSLEPAGGSPTGAPTGPVIYQGRLVPEAP